MNRQAEVHVVPRCRAGAPFTVWDRDVPLTTSVSGRGERIPRPVRERLLIDNEDTMSLQLSAKAPVRTLASGSDEPRAASRHARGRHETGESPTSHGIACRDVIDEVRQRMAVRGFRWD